MDERNAFEGVGEAQESAAPNEKMKLDLNNIEATQSGLEVAGGFGVAEEIAPETEPVYQQPPAAPVYEQIPVAAPVYQQAPVYEQIPVTEPVYQQAPVYQQIPLVDPIAPVETDAPKAKKAKKDTQPKTGRMLPVTAKE